MSISYGISGYRPGNLSELRVHLLADREEYVQQLLDSVEIPPETKTEYVLFGRNDAVTQILGKMFPLTVTSDVQCNGNSIRSVLEDMFTEMYEIAYHQGWNDRGIP